MKFPPNWSMESILIVALAAAVIVVVFAQSSATDRSAVTVERQERSELARELRPSFVEVEDALLGR